MIKVPAAKIQFLPEDRQWIAEKIQEVLTSGQLTLGKYGAEFEKEFAGYCGARHAVAVSSGTSSIEIILRSIGVAGKKIIPPAVRRRRGWIRLLRRHCKGFFHVVSSCGWVLLYRGIRIPRELSKSRAPRPSTTAESTFPPRLRAERSVTASRSGMRIFRRIA